MGINYRDGYKYQLAAQYSVMTGITGNQVISDFYILAADGNLLIFKGYAWDGCSGPTYDDRTNMRGSLVHDVLYQLMQDGLISSGLKDKADRLFAAICQEDGMSAIRAFIYYQAVKYFGKTERRITPVLEAP